MGRKYVLGLDLGTLLGVARVFTDGEIDAQTVRLEATIGARTVGVAGIVKCFAGPDCLGVCIEEQFSGQFSSVKALFPMLGAAILACELEGPPWSAVHLALLKRHATGKGKEARHAGCGSGAVGVCLKEDEADAVCAAAFALDGSLFG